MTLAFALRELPPATRIDLSDPDQYQANLTALYGDASTSFDRSDGPFVMSGHVIDMGDIALTTVRASHGHDVVFDAFESYAQSFHVHGTANIRRSRSQGRISAGYGALANGGERFVLSRSAGSELFTVRIRPPALMSKLSALLGREVIGKCTFDPDAPADSPPMQAFLGTLSLLIDAYHQLEGSARDTIVVELQQSAIAAFVFANRHTYSDWLERRGRDAAPWQVRTAEEYIEANWQKALTIERLVEVTGAGTRSLFEAFRKYRGYSPMAFLKRVRLRKARDLLSSTDAAVSVTDVAYACGFGNLGHFAQAYRTAFGERPSETLSTARIARFPVSH